MDSHRYLLVRNNSSNFPQTQLFDGIVAWQTDVLPNFVLLVLTVVSGISYLILKYIKKRTELLDEKGR